ncbi:uncharacterized protein CcaverHIS019_0703650 [Cutaneotrichosporon cavernicola]|uniref:Uncharacterized protein n=1 Tax=Cutaneotrichosporon cavernicola TaxID=279322 RepID=A0AA48QYK7_9TREE|nr:uncharacterized protein CcaverHIS019_0703650 [Cutaneotrichosporon cavernicola]BEI94784.1 hypothetical protein CcaverHIS019_0703650 [Cutaneotrichosporon cavernicola]BEJ10316.1 hypothetical protein CcaverHIS641_0703510 [Cutaneotrichosporon cavernicola]
MFNSYDNFGVKNDFHARSQWRLNPGFNDGKHQHESDFDIADLGSGMTKMVNGIKDLTIKGTMCLSPRQKDTFQAEPWLPGPYESENDGGANHPNAALRNDTEHSSVTIPTSRSFHDGPANRTRSKTRMGSGNTADGSANSASLSNPPPVRRRKVLTGPNNRKRRSATVDNYGSNGGPSLRRRFPSSGERSCKEAVKAVTTRRSQRLKRA